MLVTSGVRIERFGPVDDDIFELRVQFFKYSLGKPGSYVADGLVGVGVTVIASQQECPVH